MQILSKTKGILNFIPKRIYFGYGLDNKDVRELLVHHDGKLETCPFRGPLFINKKSAREHILHKIINMDQDPNTSTRIFIRQYQVLPNLQLLVID